MVISSYVIATVPDDRESVAEVLIGYEGVEVHGHEENRLIVSIEADSIDATYKLATTLTQLKGVLTVNLVYCNFEDENLPDKRS